MAAGLTANLTLAQFNAQTGQILLNLSQALDQINEVYIFLQALGGSNLTTTLGMASGDVATLTSAFNDAYQIYQIYHSQATLGTAKDFTANIKLVIGTGVH